MLAHEAVVTIINEKRPLPQKGAYRLARLYDKLLPEYNTINARRIELIKPLVPKDEAGEIMPGAEVPPEKIAEWQAVWADFAKEEIEVTVEAVPLAQLVMGDDVPGSITVAELIQLGDLVKDD